MTGNEVEEEEIKPGWVYVVVGVGRGERGVLPEESLMPQYRLWAFVTHKFGIRALCVAVCVCGNVRGKWPPLQSAHGSYRSALVSVHHVMGNARGQSHQPAWLGGCSTDFTQTSNITPQARSPTLLSFHFLFFYLGMCVTLLQRRNIQDI